MRPTTTRTKPRPRTTVPARENSHNSTRTSIGETKRRRKPITRTTTPKPKDVSLSKVLIKDANPSLISIPEIIEAETNYIELLYNLIPTIV
jgi:hypothetical protein